jgi:hypothetical protein
MNLSLGKTLYKLSLKTLTMNERKMICLQVPTHLNKWLDMKGIEKFGRKNSKSDFIRSVLMDKYDEEMKEQK